MLCTYNHMYSKLNLLSTMYSLRFKTKVTKQKLLLDIICVMKQKVRLVKFLSNFVNRTGILPETM